MLKRLLSLSLSAVILLSGCSNNMTSSTPAQEQLNVHDVANNEIDDQIASNPDISNNEISVSEITDLRMLPVAEGEDVDVNSYEYEVNFANLDSDDLQRYVTDSLYDEVLSNLDGTDYYVSEIRSVFISQEYIDELAYNSKSNIYFGYTLEELDAQFKGSRYIFTLGDQGDTIVTEYEEYDDSYNQLIQNVSTGTGVILLAINLSESTSKYPTVSMIFAFSALTGTVVAVSAAGLATVVSAAVIGIQTGDMEKARNEAMLIGSEAFKWGAMIGTVGGAVVGTQQAVTGAGAVLSPEVVGIIQKDLKYPIYIIRNFYGIEEAEELKAANLIPKLINGATALVRLDIDLDYIDELGRSNLQRMLLGLAPCDSNGNEYLLRMIGEGSESALAILTEDEAKSPNLSNFVDISQLGDSKSSDIRKKFWKTMASLLLELAE